MIELQNVSKQYKRTLAIDDITLAIRENGIYSLLGRNGAGKTTFMKLVAGHIEASSGVVKVDGKTVSLTNMPENVSFIESRATQFNMTVSSLIFAAHDLQKDFDLAFAEEMLNRFRLDRKKRYKQLSFGMQTMVATIVGLASGAKVVMLDEPVLGFDAIMRKKFNEFLVDSFRRKPRIIIVSTHLIEDIANVAQKLVVIDNGKILSSVSIGEITAGGISLTNYFINLVGGKKYV
jgi:ABC-2 type transport system ATP-binding protein